jgi:hypothetical protein
MRCGCGRAPLIPPSSAETEGRAAPCVGPGGADWDPVRAEDRYSLRVLACRDGLWERLWACWRRLRDWYKAGVWRRLHQVLLEELARADRIDWDRAALDSAAVPAPGGPGNGQEPNGPRQTGHEAPSCGRRPRHPARGHVERRQRPRLQDDARHRRRHRAHPCQIPR